MQKMSLLGLFEHLSEVSIRILNTSSKCPEDRLIFLGKLTRPVWVNHVSIIRKPGSLSKLGYHPLSDQ